MKITQRNKIRGVLRLPSKTDRSKSTFCIKLAKINILTVKAFVQRSFWSFKRTLLLIPGISTTQINKTEGIPRPSSEAVVTQSRFFVQLYKLGKMNISMTKIFVQRNFYSFKTTFI